MSFRRIGYHLPGDSGEADGVGGDEGCVGGEDAVDEPEEVADGDEVFYDVGASGEHPRGSEDGGYPADDGGGHCSSSVNWGSVYARRYIRRW